MKPRRITTHESIAGPQKNIDILVHDKPGAGGACHKYVISIWGKEELLPQILLCFQEGAIQEKGVNGVTNEVLLAVLIDRMEGFQTGEFNCEENATALSALNVAMRALQQRTLDRVARGVEGTSKK